MLSSHTLGLTIRIREHSGLCELAGWWKRGKLSWPRATFDAPDPLVMKINTFEEENVLLCPQGEMCLTKVKGANMLCFIDCMKAKNVLMVLAGLMIMCGHFAGSFSTSTTRAKSRQPADRLPSPAFSTSLPPYHFPQLLNELQLHSKNIKKYLNIT